MARKTHKDVEFAVADRHYDRFDEACGVAVARSASTGEDVFLDTLVYSKAGARWLGSDDAVEEYEEDPDASVFQRIIIRADNLGRVR